VGTFENPSYVTFDLRAQYVRRVGPVNTEFFVDTFDLFNNQAEIQLNDLEAGLGTVKYGEAVTWVLPRRAFIDFHPTQPWCMCRSNARTRWMSTGWKATRSARSPSSGRTPWRTPIR
jgi:hypothetical protein